MARVLRMLVFHDLKARKGIPWSRQRLHEKIKDGDFPPPDGKTADSKNAPNFWLESTIDAYIKKRAEAHAKVKAEAHAAKHGGEAAAETPRVDVA